MDCWTGVVTKIGPYGGQHALRAVKICTISVLLLFIGGNTTVSSRLYAGLCHAFLVYLFEANYRRIYWTDFYVFLPNDRHFRECERSRPLFPITQGMLHGNQFYGKIWVYAFIRQSDV